MTTHLGGTKSIKQPSPAAMALPRLTGRRHWGAAGTYRHEERRLRRHQCTESRTLFMNYRVAQWHRSKVPGQSVRRVLKKCPFTERTQGDRQFNGIHPTTFTADNLRRLAGASIKPHFEEKP
ncbi:hypothetical protein [Noviherbaspirillum humi]|uniref:hypothetical protein n=1 Tax=Noviherbaspirillum humi TaxID=1688639 RepID=UPI0011607015|nr:hypothetical protein [Noviherbaspirillum humi]